MIIKYGHQKDKFLITYGFHPGEEYSYQIGSKLEKNPPKNSEVIYFRPPSIKHNHRELSWPSQIKQSYAGRMELKRHALNLYDKLPFIVELHDTENYFTDMSDYMIVYSNRNKKLDFVLNEYKKSRPSESLRLIDGEPSRYQPSLHSATLEYFPVHFHKEDGNFRTLTVQQGEEFARRIMDLLYKNRYQV